MDKNLLKRATEDTKEPTPGYMYREIVKMTYTDLNIQNKVIEFLLEKVREPTNKSTYVLSKTLRVLKHICMEGHADCQKAIQKNAEIIRSCANYRGKPDATFGDMLNQQVRDAARETMEAAFSTRRDNRNNMVIGEGHGANKEQVNAIGSSGTFSTGYTVGSSSNDVQSSNKVNAITSQVKEAVKTGFGLWKEAPKTAKQQIIEEVERQAAGQTHGQYQKLNVAITDDAPVVVPVPRGVLNDIVKDGEKPSHVQVDWKSLGSVTANVSAQSKSQKATLTPAQAIVEKIVTYKETPQRFELANFQRSAVEAVEQDQCTWNEFTTELDQYLNISQPWQTRLNTVCCIESLVKSNVESVVEHYTKSPEDLQRCVNVVQRTLKERAERVLTLLGVPHTIPRVQPTSDASNESSKGKHKGDVVAAIFAAAPGSKQEMTWSASLTGNTALPEDCELKVKERAGRGRGGNKLRTRPVAHQTTGGALEVSDPSNDHGVKAVTVESTPGLVPARPVNTVDFMDELFSTPNANTQTPPFAPPSAGAFLDASLFQQPGASSFQAQQHNFAPTTAPPTLSASESAERMANIPTDMGMQTITKPVSKFGFL